MSGTVDDEVVRMRFDNSTFERAVSVTLGTLSKLKNSLSFPGAAKGLSDVEAKANRFSLAGMSSGIEGVSKKFLALSTIGITALSNLTTKAIDAGLRLAKAFTIAPIMEGFHSYETQINAAKTIISNTGAKLPAVEAQLGQLQTYANQTVYSFQDMAQNIGTFTAAGVKLVPATSAIKGMGNTAALSGANVQQLNSAMYQMSQAMSSGVIRLQDWNSLSNANMGGQNIQKVLMATASTIDGTGPKMDKALKKYGNFRNSLTDGWLTADVFSKSMGIMAGQVDKATGKTVAFSVAQLKAKGYTEAQAKNLHRLSQAAIESATQIRTFTQMQQALKEEVGTAWSTVFKTIFGNVNGATKLFTALHTTLENAFTQPIYALNNLLKGVVKLGGRSKAIDAIKNVFEALGRVMAPIKAAFHDIFPPATAKSLFILISRFDEFTKKLKIGGDTADKIHRTFAGFFAILDIGKQIVGQVFHLFGTLFGVLTHGSGGFLTFTAHIGDMIVAFDKALKQGSLFANFFYIIGKVLSVPLKLLGKFGDYIAGLFSGFKQNDANGMTNSVLKAGDALAHVADLTKSAGKWFAGLAKKIKPAVNAVVQAFHNIGAAIAKGLGSASFANVLSTLQVGLLGGIVVLLKKFMSKGFSVDIGGGLLGKAGEAIEGLTGNLKAMQTELKARALLEIAAAIGILAASVVALSFINPTKLEASLKAMAVGFGELLAAMGILTKISGSAGFIKIPLMAASLDLLAVAILLLTGAVAAMAQLSWDQLERGLTAVGVLLAAVSAASIPLSKNSGGMVRAGIGIAAIAVAMNILYLAVKHFSGMKWGELMKGLSAVGIALGGIAIAMHAMPKSMFAQGAALVLIAGAINLLYLAVRNFSGMKWGELVKGLVGIGGALVGIAIGMQLMPKSMILQAVALGIVAASLQLIDKAVAGMAKMNWGDIVKGITGLAGALLVLAGGMYLMQDTLGGAAALLITAAALRIFVPVLQSLADMSWAQILSGLGALALSFAAIGISAALLTPVIPALLGLGIALGVVGLAMLAFGAGASLLGVGLTAIATAGGAAVGVLISALKGIIGLLPTLATNLAKFVVNFITIIGENAPKVAEALGKLIVALLKIIVDNTPKIVAAGIKLILALLDALTRNTPKLVKAAADLIVAFMTSLGDQLPKMIDAAFKLVVKFLNGLADAIHKNLGPILKAAARIGIAIIQGIWDGISSLISWIWGKITGFFSWLWDKIKGWFGIHSPSTKMAEIGVSLIQGLWNGISSLVSWIWGKISGFFSWLWGKMKAAIGAVVSIGKAIVGAIWSGISSLVGWIWGKISGFFSGLWSHMVSFAKTAVNIGKSIVGAIWNGISSLAGWIGSKVGSFVSGIFGSIGDVVSSARSVGTSLVEGLWSGISGQVGQVVGRIPNAFAPVTNAIRGAFRVASPSKFTIWVGEMIMQGLSDGIAGNVKTVTDSVGVMGDALVKAVTKIPDNINNLDIQPTITPVLDLSNVQKDASRIGGILASRPLNVSTSLQHAADISAARQQEAEAAATTPSADAQPPVASIELKQYNTSPKALSTIDIYRNTKNQLALAKRALGMPTP